MTLPLAYHITWGTYGTRLHGSSRPHVDRNHNQFGKPFPPADPDREHAVRQRMKFDPCRLTIKQRMCVEEAIRELASRYRWTIHALAVQSDHPHVVITAPRAGDQLREALKAVATRALNKRFGQRRWWAEGGSAKYIWDDEYLARAIRYDLDQRDF